MAAGGAVAAPSGGGLLGRGAAAGWLLAAMVVAAFWPALNAAFVWDDSIFLLEAEPVQEWGGLWDIWFNPSSMAEGHYWPLVYSSFWLEHKLWGYNAAGFHATNLLLHIVNSLLLWGLAKRLALPGAWLVAAVFALHPVHAEPVVWVISRKDLLGALFYLLAAGAWLNYKETGRGDLLVMGLFVAGLLSKSFVVTLPAALLALAWWQAGRITRVDLAQTAPLFLVGLAITAFDLWFYFGRALLAFDHSLAERLIIAGKSLWFYAGQLLWPHPLPIIYPRFDVNPWTLWNWLPLLGALALALGLWLARGRIGRGPLAGALFFAITLSPALGLANNSYMAITFVADRYQYLASAGLLAAGVAGAVLGWRWLAALAWGGAGGAGSGAADRAGQGDADWARASGGARPWRRWLARYGAGALAAALLAVYGALCFRQAEVYRDALAFFGHIRTLNPGEYHGHYNLGLALMERGRYAEAEEPTRRAIALEPESSSAHQNLAVIMHNLGRYDETLAALRQATSLADKRTAEQFYHLGHIAAQVAHYEEAEEYLRQALDLEPDHLEAKQELLFVYLDAGRHEDARALRPGLEETLRQGAAVHYSQGEPEEALRLYRHLAALAPGRAEDQAALGGLLLELGRAQEAQASLERALALDPEALGALAQLATLHFKAGRFGQAEALFARVLALQPDNAEAHSNLGSALAQAGRYAEAIARFERALELDPGLASARANLDLARARLGQGQ